LDAELDRVGVSFGKAGAKDYVAVLNLGEFVDLLGPPRIQPRPNWRGSEQEALALLAPLPDDAGPDEFWRTAQAGRAEATSRIAASGAKPCTVA
jgi:hypothetical protein